LTLEHIEDAFYKEGLAKFSHDDFVKAGLPHFTRGRLQQVADHERTHVVVLEKVLGDKATKPCTYKLCVTSHNIVSLDAYTGTAHITIPNRSLRSLQP
jgi:hypothetical protein